MGIRNWDSNINTDYEVIRMKIYEYDNKIYTIKQLSELSGIAPATLRDRIRRGYSVEQAVKAAPTNDSVQAFCDASWWEDWIGMENSYLHKIYWNWSISNGYFPVPLKTFIKEIMTIYPQLQIVPSKKGNRYCRIIRLK